MPQASIFQQRTNLADVERKSCQTSLANTAWGKTDFIKTVIAFMDTHLKTLFSAYKWVLPKKVLRRDYPEKYTTNITTVSFFEPYLIFILCRS